MGEKNDTRPKMTPSSDVMARKPLASKIPAYLGVCVPPHENIWEYGFHRKWKYLL